MSAPVPTEGAANVPPVHAPASVSGSAAAHVPAVVDACVPVSAVEGVPVAANRVAMDVPAAVSVPVAMNVPERVSVVDVPVVDVSVVPTAALSESAAADVPAVADVPVAKGMPAAANVPTVDVPAVDAPAASAAPEIRAAVHVPAVVDMWAVEDAPVEVKVPVAVDMRAAGGVRAADLTAGADALGTGSPSGAGDSRRLAWVYLSRVVQGPCAPLSALIESVGVVEAARAVRECALPEPLRGPTAQRRQIDVAARDLETIERIGGRVVTPDDPEWPAWRMLGLAQLEPGRDRDGAVPLVLWARGPRSLLESSERAIAVVGARCSTGYGNRVTGEIAGDLAAQGWTIVSGAAFGIDGMAHRAALAVEGPTIAVLACGIDRPYPAQHERLLADIAESGLVISEYPPGVTAQKHQFLARNRLIAALADGVLVIEAGLRSGARNTVKWARRLGRPALAVPGPVTSAASVGCHRMIRDGEALLVTRAEEVVDEAGPLRLSLPAAGAGGSPEDQLTGDEALTFAALPRVGSRLPLEVSRQCGLSLPAVRAALAALELAGLVASDESGWHRTARRR